MPTARGLDGIGNATIASTTGVNLSKLQELGGLAPAAPPTSHVRGDGTGQTQRYGNKPTEVDGYTFASKKEAKWYGILKALLAVGRIGNLVVHPVYPLFGRDGSEVGKYIADFSYTEFSAGTSKRVVIDVKSAITRKKDVYRLKRKLFKASYGFDITER